MIVKKENGMYHPLPLRWWHIYARFKVAEEHDETFVFPHLGQVVGYYRRLRKQTKKEMAEALSWSEGFVRKVEGSAHQPERLERRIALARHLQIVPMLMRIPIHLFEEEEEPQPVHPSVLDLERKNLMAADLPVEEKLHRLEENFQKQVQHVFTRSYPLSLEAFAIYGEALNAAQELFMRERGVDGIYRNLLETQDILPDAEFLGRTLMERSVQSHLKEQVQLALSNVDFWLEKLNTELQYSRDYRYDQHLFLQYQFCNLVSEVAKYSQDVAAAIDGERALHYATFAVDVASSLGNAEYAGKALLQRAIIHLEQEHYEQALQDLEEMLFYCEVLIEALGDDLVPVFLACSVGQLVWQTKNKTIAKKLHTLHQKAQRIAHITHEDLTGTKS
jgi:tetratricopeptide (TPR) repeat protein